RRLVSGTWLLAFPAATARHLPFPHKGIKHLPQAVAQPTVEFHRAGIGFGHGEREHAELPPAELRRVGRQEHLADAAPAEFREYADLRDVPNVRLYPRAEHQAEQIARALLRRHKR